MFKQLQVLLQVQADCLHNPVLLKVLLPLVVMLKMKWFGDLNWHLTVVAAAETAALFLTDCFHLTFIVMVV